uniref:Uncharacterized protein n=1 Tax=Heterorhabditis bacteriophora TaxID=37862 RepID=A0A1I7WGV8_HETBA
MKNLNAFNEGTLSLHAWKIWGQEKKTSILTTQLNYAKINECKANEEYCIQIIVYNVLRKFMADSNFLALQSKITTNIICLLYSYKYIFKKDTRITNYDKSLRISIGESSNQSNEISAFEIFHTEIYILTTEIWDRYLPHNSVEIIAYITDLVPIPKLIFNCYAKCRRFGWCAQRPTLPIKNRNSNINQYSILLPINTGNQFRQTANHMKNTPKVFYKCLYHVHERSMVNVSFQTSISLTLFFSWHIFSNRFSAIYRYFPYCIQYLILFHNKNNSAPK